MKFWINFTRIWLTIIAFLVVVAATVVTYDEAEASMSNNRPGNCKWIGWTNAYADVKDTNLDIGAMMADKDWYPSWNCNPGARVYYTEANTHYETIGLKNMFLKSRYGAKHGIPDVFCRTSKDTAYYMGEQWSFDFKKISESDKRRYRAFAHTWVQEHDGCRLGK